MGLRMQHVKNTGAFPRDSMDRRLFVFLDSAIIDMLPVDGNDYYNDAFIIDYDTTSASYPSDFDGDGMPDWWEIHHGSDPNIPNHNDLDLSTKYAITPSYPNIELYLNKLSDSLVTRKSTLLDTASKSVYELLPSSVRITSNGSILLVEADGSYDLTLSDVTGRTLYSSHFMSHFTHDFGEALASGVYFVVLRSKEEVVSHKVLIR
jgi:hypothetical protein